MRSVLLAFVAALVFASSAPIAWASAEAPPTTGKTATADAGPEIEGVWFFDDPKHKERKWIAIGAAAAGVALVGVLAARWSKGGAATTPPAA